MSRAFFQPPRLRRDEHEEGERHATWLELFFDLVFVVAVAQLAHNYTQHFSLSGLIEFALLFVPVWWCWVGSTFYATRFDTDGLLDCLFILIQIAIIAIMAANVHQGLDKTSLGFALNYVAFRILLVGQYLCAGFYIPEARSLTIWYSVGFSSSLILWLISIFIPLPWGFGLWILGLMIDFATPLTAGRIVATIPPSFSHITERIGLFTIIVLGESVVAVVGSIAEQEWSLTAIAC